MAAPKVIAVTGAPGTGKSMLVDALGIAPAEGRPLADVVILVRTEPFDNKGFVAAGVEAAVHAKPGAALLVICNTLCQGPLLYHYLYKHCGKLARRGCPEIADLDALYGTVGFAALPMSEGRMRLLGLPGTAPLAPLFGGAIGELRIGLGAGIVGYEVPSEPVTPPQ